MAQGAPPAHVSRASRCHGRGAGNAPAPAHDDRPECVLSPGRRALDPGASPVSAPPDGPLLGSLSVRSRLTGRTFVCRTATFVRRLFTARLPTLVAVYARRTRRLVAALQAIGIARRGNA